MIEKRDSDNFIVSCDYVYCNAGFEIKFINGLRNFHLWLCENKRWVLRNDRCFCSWSHRRLQMEEEAYTQKLRNIKESKDSRHFRPPTQEGVM